MDFIKGNMKSIYLKYLGAAFGSALITSIYSIVDMAMVGQYQGPDGTAALAVVAPIWNIIYSLGLLMGIGGAVIFSTLKGQDGHKAYEAQEVFTVSLIGSVVLAMISWTVIIVFDQQLLMLFGAQESLLPLGLEYLKPIQYVIPCFLINQMLVSYLRNDNAPTLATIGVLLGGVFNIFGDYFFVFGMDMGIAGAGLATAMGAVISTVVMLIHFVKKENSLKIVPPKHFFENLQKITVTGFSTFFIDVAMGILTIFFNRQIMKYLGTEALSVYGIIVNISTFVQCCAYSVGQASQPIISVNYGAHQVSRIQLVLKYALLTVAFFSLLWTLLSLLTPMLFVSIFMTPAPEITTLAPQIIRCYGLSFLLLPFNIFSTYYFQALLQPKVSFIVAVSRGLVVSGILIYILPLIHPDMLWWTMVVTEIVVAFYAGLHMFQYTRQLSVES